jgi:hypothetical protein
MKTVKFSRFMCSLLFCKTREKISRITRIQAIKKNYKGNGIKEEIIKKICRKGWKNEASVLLILS